MRNNLVHKLILVSVFGSMIALTAHNLLTIPAKKRVGNNLDKSTDIYPSFTFSDLMGKSYSGILNGRSILIMFFDPECIYCEDKIKQIIKYEREFVKSELIFVSPADKEKVVKFVDDLQVTKLKNSHVLLADYNLFYEAFQTTNIPSFLIYDKNGNKMVTINESTDIKTIVKYVRAANDR